MKRNFSQAASVISRRRAVRSVARPGEIRIREKGEHGFGRWPLFTQLFIHASWIFPFDSQASFFFFICLIIVIQIFDREGSVIDKVRCLKENRVIFVLQEDYSNGWRFKMIYVACIQGNEEKTV